MKLIDHLKATGEPVDDFASRIGEAVSTIRKIAYGQRQPSLPLAVKIEQATAGVVTGADMLLVMPSETVPSSGNLDQFSAPSPDTEISRPKRCAACSRRPDEHSLDDCRHINCPVREADLDAADDAALAGLRGRMAAEVAA